jgi:drug/metabolite transporter (DMT)-like permease
VIARAIPQGLQIAGLTGVALTALYTALIAGADAITKLFAASYAAPQLFALSGAVVAALSLAANRKAGRWRGVRTTCPRMMALRAAATVAGCVAFFYAFRLLPFAEVFIFIALIPLLAALLSGPVLGEPVRPQVWIALLFGSTGVLFLFPTGLSSLGAGHLVAFAAVALGTVSMIASRYIGQRDDNLLAQVFYPNLALMGVMACALPFVWQPMGLADLGWALAYAVVLFGARWVLVAALRLLARLRGDTADEPAIPVDGGHRDHCLRRGAGRGRLHRGGHRDRRGQLACLGSGAPEAHVQAAAVPAE